MGKVALIAEKALMLKSVVMDKSPEKKKSPN